MNNKDTKEIRERLETHVSRSRGELFAMLARIQEHNELAKKAEVLVNFIVSEHRNPMPFQLSGKNPLRLELINILPDLLCDEDLSDFAGYVFRKIEEQLRIKLKDNMNIAEKISLSSIVESDIKQLQSSAEKYFKKTEKQKIKDLRLWEQLTSVKKSLIEVDKDVYPPRHKALLEIEKEIESEMAIQKEEAAHRKELGILNVEEISMSTNEAEKEDTEFQSLRQKIITLMLLTFGRLEPAEDIPQKRIEDFFRGLIGGGDIKKVRRLVKNPVAHKGTDLSIKLLCEDLNFVRDSLGRLGLNQNVKQAANEIQFLIDNLEKNSSFD